MSSSEPNPIDIEVGLRLRLLRRERGLSQTELARALGLTFQQVQKYEKGTNRISASKLWEAARFLSVPVSAFFGGDERPPPRSEAMAALTEPDTVRLLEAWSRIERVDQRRALLALVRSLPDDA